jgi:hypothetical protein
MVGSKQRAFHPELDRRGTSQGHAQRRGDRGVPAQRPYGVEGRPLNHAMHQTDRGAARRQKTQDGAAPQPLIEAEEQNEQA